MLFGIELTFQNIVLSIIGLAALFYFTRLALTISNIVTRLDTLLPVMFAMASQFKNDSGSTLKDQIDALRESAMIAASAATKSELLADGAQQRAELIANMMQSKIDIIQQEQLRLIALTAQVAGQVTTNVVQMDRSKSEQTSAGTAIDQAKTSLEQTKQGVKGVEESITEIEKNQVKK